MRYQGTDIPAKIHREEGSIVSLAQKEFISEGQSLVIYDKEVCIGGGIVRIAHGRQSPMYTALYYLIRTLIWKEIPALYQKNHIVGAKVSFVGLLLSPALILFWDNQGNLANRDVQDTKQGGKGDQTDSAMMESKIQFLLVTNSQDLPYR